MVTLIEVNEPDVVLIGKVVKLVDASFAVVIVTSELTPSSGLVKVTYSVPFTSNTKSA